MQKNLSQGLLLALLQHHLSSTSFAPSSMTKRTTGEGHETTAKHALLISSFTEGVMKSDEAQEFLRDGITSSMLQQEAIRLESKLNVNSASASDKELVDTFQVKDLLHLLEDPVLRFVYIPTAMFAHRTDDSRSYEEQLRQAKKTAHGRRNQITSTLSPLFGESVSIHAVTLDLYDGSIQKREGSDNRNDFPSDGKEALGEWKPHLVYIEGGNTFWLYHCIEKGNWKKAILNAVTGDEAAVYCGKSAGAIVAGATIDTATWKEWDDPSVVPGKETYDDWANTQGMNLISGTSVFPHMKNKWKKTVSKKRKRVTSPVHCLRDSEVCLFDGRNEACAVVSADVELLVGVQSSNATQ